MLLVIDMGVKIFEVSDEALDRVVDALDGGRGLTDLLPLTPPAIFSIFVGDGVVGVFKVALVLV